MRICVLVLIQKVLCPITIILLKNYFRCVSLFCSHDFLAFLPLNAGVVGLGSDPVVPAGMMTLGEMVTLDSGQLHEVLPGMLCAEQ